MRTFDYIFMTLKKIACGDCGKEFQFEKTSRYTRKYCDKCSKKRKKEYENLYTAKFEDLEDD